MKHPNSRKRAQDSAKRRMILLQLEERNAPAGLTSLLTGPLSAVGNIEQGVVAAVTSSATNLTQGTPAGQLVSGAAPVISQPLPTPSPILGVIDTIVPVTPTLPPTPITPPSNGGSIGNTGGTITPPTTLPPTTPGTNSSPGTTGTTPTTATPFTPNSGIVSPATPNANHGTTGDAAIQPGTQFGNAINPAFAQVQPDNRLAFPTNDNGVFDFGAFDRGPVGQFVAPFAFGGAANAELRLNGDSGAAEETTNDTNAAAGRSTTTATDTATPTPSTPNRETALRLPGPSGGDTAAVNLPLATTTTTSDNPVVQFIRTTAGQITLATTVVITAVAAFAAARWQEIHERLSRVKTPRL
ncbi:MAG: hypothetical protein ACJ8C4_05510 [Gemmataceae bacterium]